MSSAIMTADWAARSGDRWTVPAGGGVGRFSRSVPQLVNSRVQFWDDVKSSPGYQTWTMQMQFQLLFPKKR
jgi:hypothetical protein